MGKEKEINTNLTLTNKDLMYEVDQWTNERGVIVVVHGKEYTLKGTAEELSADGNIILMVGEEIKKPFTEPTPELHAIRNLKAATRTTRTEVVYKDRAVLTVTKTFDQSSRYKYHKYYYETTIHFVLNGKQWKDKRSHQSLNKALKFGHDIFISRNNNMIKNNYKLKEDY